MTTMMIAALIIAGSIQGTVLSTLPTITEYVEVFGDPGSRQFSISTFESLDKERRDFFAAASQKGREQLCMEALWSRNHMEDCMRVFIALSGEPELQARFAAYCTRLDSYWGRFFLYYYRYEPDSLVSALDRIRSVFENEFGEEWSWNLKTIMWGSLLMSVREDIYTPEESTNLVKRCLWTMIRKRAISEEELHLVEVDDRSAIEVLRFATSVAGCNSDLVLKTWEILAQIVPPQTMVSVGHAMQEGALSDAGLEISHYISIEALGLLPGFRQDGKVRLDGIWQRYLAPHYKESLGKLRNLRITEDPAPLMPTPAGLPESTTSEVTHE